MNGMNWHAIKQSDFLRKPAVALGRAVTAFLMVGGLFPGGISAANVPTTNSESIHLTSVSIEPCSFQTNLLTNPGFEEAEASGIPKGWNWDRRNTDAICRTDRSQAHHGRQSLFLTNGTDFGAHVYGTLWRAEPIKLVSGKTYTMSAWVKSEAPGIMSLIGGTDWQFRTQASPTGGKWFRITKSFTPGPADCNFTLRINTESVTSGAWIDDVKLEEGSTATIDPAGLSENTPVSLDAENSDLLIQGDGAFDLAFVMTSCDAMTGTWTATLSSGETCRQPANFAAGTWRVRVKGDAASALDTPRTLALRLTNKEGELAVAEAALRFYSPSNALLQLQVLKNRIPSLQQDLKALKERGVDTSYPRVTSTVLENFIDYAEEDARHGEVRRSLEQIADMQNMASRLERELKEALAGQRLFEAVPRWTGEKRPQIKGSSFIAPVRLPGGNVVERPVFFNGYGHFGRVVSDMEKWPDYGANIIQIEVGPSAIFPSETQTNEAPIHALLQTLDRAQKSGVAVCLLISPHYLPDWALKKWPDLNKHRDGFLQYCLHAPEGREFLRRFIAVLIPPIKDHPALHSICLSNEPVNQEEPCEPARRQWQAWLEKRHGNIASLNSLCGSNFTAFAQVSLPDPFESHPAQAIWMDYLRFNQESFAEWHAMLADSIHRIARDLPVHAKAMTWTMTKDIEVKRGVDATLFGRFSNINGNDAANIFNYGDGEFAQGWVDNAMGHDLQRSVLDAPVFNTENHVITDRDTRPVPPAHIRAALWQAAVHGQSATTVWVWERTFDPKSDFSGSIMHRPACAEAVGVLNYDLNRAALEITAIQQAPPQVLLLQSLTASAWDAGRYSECLEKLYTALSFTGLKPGFITERQLEAGIIPSTAVVFVPGITHLSSAALSSLSQYKGRLVFVGDGGLLTHDEYGQPATLKLTGENIPFKPSVTSSRDLRRQIIPRLSTWNVQPDVTLLDASNQPAWGVEWRTANMPAGLIINLCNYDKKPATLTLLRNGQAIAARDVLNETQIKGPLTLAPLEVRLLRVEPAN
jgi:hypothetical protein